MLISNIYKYATGAGVAVTLLFPSQAFAEQWQLTPRFTLEGVYDDNIRLTTGPHDSVTGALLKGNIGFSRLTEVSAITGRLFASFSDYSGDEVVSDNNNDLDFVFASHTKSERTRWGLDGAYRLDTTLRRLDSLEGEEDAVESDIDEGLVDINVRRKRLQVLPSWQHSLSERTDLRVAYTFNDISYDNNPAGSGLFDYDQHNVSAGFFRRLTERDTINVNVGVSRFESPGNANSEVDGYSFTVGYKRAFTETMSGSVNVGANRSTQKSDVLTTDVDTDGYIFRVNLDSKTETTRYRVSLSHDLQPSGTGTILEANRFKFDIRHRFSRRMSGFLVMQFNDKDTLNSSVSNNFRYYIIRPRLSWKLSPWLTLTGGYDYRNSKRGSNADDAESNAVYISLSHNKPITLD